jgi:hypothetical protein
MEHIANFAEKLSVLKQDIKHYAQYIKEFNSACKADHKLGDFTGEWHEWKRVSTNRNKFTEKWESIWSPSKLCCHPIERTHHFYKANKCVHSYAYRHLHIAYSLLKGKTMKEIENTVRVDNEPNLELIERIIEHYMGITNFFKELMDFRRKKPRVIKMYVLVREDLDPINRAVQAGHAVAEYMQIHTPSANDDSGNRHLWRNGYMIYLGVKNEQELSVWEAKLCAAQKRFATFVEPDWGEPTKTALACVDFGNIFEELPLMSLASNEESTSDVVMTDETVVK